MTVTLANIPILDANGPTFLTIYGIFFLVALIWSHRRAKRALNRFDREGYFPELTDPYEIAYLAAGPPRVAQLAVVRLIHQGLVEWRSSWSGPKIVDRKIAPAGETHAVEKRILEASGKKGAAGQPLQNVPMIVSEDMRPLEVRLAGLGLRPTTEERSTAARSAVMPLSILTLLGVVKMIIGITRDKPVLFLFLFLIISVVFAVAMAASVGKLTGTGKQLLDQLRLENERTQGGSSNELLALSTKVALLGPEALAGVPGLMNIQKDLQKRITHAGGNQSGGGCSGGCGATSSGCGSGGGSSGCGGCGGD